MFDRTAATIGSRFTCGGTVWKVTDVGTRVVIAIRDRESWMKGPPYVTPEEVFDENDFPGMEPVR